MISFTLTIISCGLMMIYLIVFGGLCSSLVFQLVYDSKGEHFFATRTCYIIILALAMLPLVLKKEIKELKIVAVIFFLCLCSFLLILITQLLSGRATGNKDKDFSVYMHTNGVSEAIQGFSIIVVAIAFQGNLFPTFNSL